MSSLAIVEIDTRRLRLVMGNRRELSPHRSMVGLTATYERRHLRYVTIIVMVRRGHLSPGIITIIIRTRRKHIETDEVTRRQSTEEQNHIHCWRTQMTTFDFRENATDTKRLGITATDIMNYLNQRQGFVTDLGKSTSHLDRGIKVCGA